MPASSETILSATTHPGDSTSEIANLKVMDTTVDPMDYIRFKLTFLEYLEQLNCKPH